MWRGSPSATLRSQDNPTTPEELSRTCRPCPEVTAADFAHRSLPVRVLLGLHFRRCREVFTTRHTVVSSRRFLAFLGRGRAGLDRLNYVCRTVWKLARRSASCWCKFCLAIRALFARGVPSELEVRSTRLAKLACLTYVDGRPFRRATSTEPCTIYKVWEGLRSIVSPVQRMPWHGTGTGWLQVPPV